MSEILYCMLSSFFLYSIQVNPMHYYAHSIALPSETGDHRTIRAIRALLRVKIVVNKQIKNYD